MQQREWRGEWAGPGGACGWLAAALRAFDGWPAMGALGGGEAVLDFHPAAHNRGLHFW